MKTKLNYPYKFIYKKMKRVSYRITNGIVEIHAPFGVDEEKVLELIANKIKDIKAETYIDLKDGGFVYMHGQKYNLNIIDKHFFKYDILEDTIVLYENNIKLVYAMLSYSIIDFVYTKLKYYTKLMDLPMPYFDIKYYKSRYGSCFYDKNTVTFNVQLAHLDLKYLESVIVHELCHFFEHNHSQRFYDLLLNYYPQYYEIHNELKRKFL